LGTPDNPSETPGPGQGTLSGWGAIGYDVLDWIKNNTNISTPLLAAVAYFAFLGFALYDSDDKFKNFINGLPGELGSLGLGISGTNVTWDMGSNGKASIQAGVTSIPGGSSLMGKGVVNISDSNVNVTLWLGIGYTLP
jgi:hypothetical protein